MTDREIMELNGQDVVDQTGEIVETVTGAGRVGIIAASYEERRCGVATWGQAVNSLFLSGIT